MDIVAPVVVVVDDGVVVDGDDVVVERVPPPLVQVQKQPLGMATHRFRYRLLQETVLYSALTLAPVSTLETQKESPLHPRPILTIVGAFS